MGFRRSKKTTTHKQFEIMVDYLREHPELNNYVPSTSAASVERRRMWNTLTELLNANGPPTRKSVEWKSIWSDYKYNVKRKLCTDIKCARGKIRRKRLLFTKIETKVIGMLNLTQKLCGRHYKLNQKPTREKNVNDQITVSHEELITAIKPEPTTSEEDNVSILMYSDLESAEEKSEHVDDVDETERHPSLKSDEIEKTAALECDVTSMLKDTLQGMQTTQMEILKELKEYNRRKKDASYFKEQQLHLEREKFEEQKKQNSEANKRASLELDLKRRELELYELKLKGSCMSCVVKTESDEYVVSSFN